ncbi:MAG TPA: LamG domain-containing protein [Labilithrix sp.]|nr:LamG domain-containing protein [Labilithrix sp.]
MVRYIRPIQCASLLVLGAICAGGIASCREATAIRVRLDTDVPWSSGCRAILSGGENPTAAEPSGEIEGPWTSTDLGDLVFVPAKDKSRPMRALAIMGIDRDPKTCTVNAPQGCIFARRKLTFAPYQTLTVPIRLHSACIGVPCDEDMTCDARGECVSAEVRAEDCASETGCLLPGDEAPLTFGGGVDAGRGDAGRGDGGPDDGDGSDSCPDPLDPDKKCTGPVAAIGLDNCSPTDSVSGNSGSVMGTTTAVTGRDGQPNGACSLTMPAYVTVNSAATASKEFSVSVWAKPNWDEIDDYGTVFSRRAETPRLAGYNIFAVANGWEVFLAPVVYNDGNPWTVIATYPGADTAWHHLALTYNGTTLKLYLDGTESASAQTTYYVDKSTPVAIGTSAGLGTNNYYFPGAIDDVRVFNRAITAAEVAALAAP